MFHIINSLPLPLFLVINIAISVGSYIYILKYKKLQQNQYIGMLIVTLLGGILMSAIKIVKQYSFNSILLLIMDMLFWLYFFILIITIIASGIKRYKSGSLTEEQKKSMRTGVIIIVIVPIVLGALMLIVN